MTFVAVALLSLVQASSREKMLFHPLGAHLSDKEYRQISIPAEIKNAPIMISSTLDAKELSRVLGHIYGSVKTEVVEGKEKFRIIMDPANLRGDQVRKMRKAQIESVQKQLGEKFQIQDASAEVLVERLLRFDRQRNQSAPLFSIDIPSQTMLPRLLAKFPAAVLADLQWGISTTFSNSPRANEKLLPDAALRELRRIQALEREMFEIARGHTWSDSMTVGLQPIFALAKGQSDEETAMVKVRYTNLGIVANLYRFNRAGELVFQNGSSLQLDLKLDWNWAPSIPETINVPNETLRLMQWILAAAPGLAVPSDEAIKVTNWLKSPDSEESLNLLWPELFPQLFRGERYVVSLPDDLVTPSCALLASTTLSKEQVRQFLVSRGVCYEKVDGIHVLWNLDPRAAEFRRYSRSAVRRGLDLALSSEPISLEVEARQLFQEASALQFSGIPPVKRCLWYLKQLNPYEEELQGRLLQLFGAFTQEQWAELRKGRSILLTSIPQFARESWRSKEFSRVASPSIQGFAHLYAPYAFRCSLTEGKVPLFRITVGNKVEVFDLFTLASALAGKGKETMANTEVEFGGGTETTLTITAGACAWSEHPRIDPSGTYTKVENVSKLPESIRSELFKLVAKIEKDRRVFETPTPLPPP